MFSMIKVVLALVVTSATHLEIFLGWKVGDNENSCQKGRGNGSS